MYEMNSFEPFHNIQSYFGNRFNKFSRLHRFEAICIILPLIFRLTFYHQVVFWISLCCLWECRLRSMRDTQRKLHLQSWSRKRVDESWSRSCTKRKPLSNRGQGGGKIKRGQGVTTRESFITNWGQGLGQMNRGQGCTMRESRIPNWLDGLGNCNMRLVWETSSL